MEEPRDVVLAGRARAHRYAEVDRRQAARRDCQGTRRTGDPGAHAQEWRDRCQQQVTGGLQDLYGRRNRQVDQGDRGGRRARRLSRRSEGAAPAIRRMSDATDGLGPATARPGLRVPVRLTRRVRNGPSLYGTEDWLSRRRFRRNFNIGKQETSVQQVEVAVIGTGWCGGIRAETLSRS